MIRNLILNQVSTVLRLGLKFAFIRAHFRRRKPSVSFGGRGCSMRGYTFPPKETDGNRVYVNGCAQFAQFSG